MLRIRLQRHGSKHSPFYRVVVAPSTVKRDGRFLEILGTYDPQNRKREAELKLNLERIDYWLGVGAQPSDTAKSLIRNGRLAAEDYVERMDKKSEGKKIARVNKAKASAVPTVDKGAGDAPAEDASADEESDEGGEPQATAEAPGDEPQVVAEEESAGVEESDEGGEPQATEDEPAEEAPDEAPAEEESAGEEEPEEESADEDEDKQKAADGGEVAGEESTSGEPEGEAKEEGQ